MKTLKCIFIFVVLTTLFTSCSTAQKLQTKAPLSIGEVYSQKWVAGVKDGGSGINLFIPISTEMPQNVQLDSVYFRGKAVKLEMIQDVNPLFVGRFITEFNQKQDIIMSSDSNQEFGNQVPLLEEKIPFELKNSECVVSYIEGKDVKYFKIENISEKTLLNYPSAPPNKQ